MYAHRESCVIWARTIDACKLGVDVHAIRGGERQGFPSSIMVIVQAIRVARRKLIFHVLILTKVSTVFWEMRTCFCLLTRHVDYNGDEECS